MSRSGVITTIAVVVFSVLLETNSCVYGYDYDKTWYERTTVSDQDWICEKALYQTNVFVWHRVGEVVGTFFFGQLGDAIGRRPVFYISASVIIIGRIMTTLTTSIYWLYAASSLISMLTSMLIFLSPLIIAMETSRGEDRGKIAMFQCIEKMNSSKSLDAVALKRFVLSFTLNISTVESISISVRLTIKDCESFSSSSVFQVISRCSLDLTDLDFLP